MLGRIRGSLTTGPGALLLKDATRSIEYAHSPTLEVGKVACLLIPLLRWWLGRRRARSVPAVPHCETGLWRTRMREMGHHMHHEGLIRHLVIVAPHVSRQVAT